MYRNRFLFDNPLVSSSAARSPKIVRHYPPNLHVRPISTSDDKAGKAYSSITKTPSGEPGGLVSGSFPSPCFSVSVETEAVETETVETVGVGENRMLRRLTRGVAGIGAGETRICSSSSSRSSIVAVACACGEGGVLGSLFSFPRSANPIRAGVLVLSGDPFFPTEPAKPGVFKTAVFSSSSRWFSNRFLRSLLEVLEICEFSVFLSSSLARLRSAGAVRGVGASEKERSQGRGANKPKGAQGIDPTSPNSVVTRIADPRIRVQRKVRKGPSVSFRFSKGGEEERTLAAMNLDRAFGKR